MEAQRIEGRWDCAYCGRTGIRARFDTCVACGKPRGKETFFYLPSNKEEAVLTKEEAEQTTNAPDWLCAYCGSYNRSDAPFCKKCGASQEESTGDYGSFHRLTGKRQTK